MIKPIDWENTRSIVGAGTGVFTRYVHELKHPHCKAVIFERDREMTRRLRWLYRGLHYRSRAEDLYPAIRQLGLSEVDCILSGLPFAVLPRSVRVQVLEGVVRSLKPGGLFIQFQYSPA